MKTFTRGLGIVLIALAATAASAGPGEPSKLSDVSVRAKKSYDASREELAKRGLAAQTAAEAGVYADWKTAHDAYMETMANMALVCEKNIADLTTTTTDLATTGAKPVMAIVTPYIENAGSMLKSRLQLLAYANLLGRGDPMDRKPALAALVHLYFTGK